MKYIMDFMAHFAGRMFSTEDAWKYLSSKGISRAYLKLMLRNLVKKGGLHRVKKGFYTFNGASSAIARAFFPSYHGLQEALSIHKIWGQAANQIIITPRRVRTGERELLGRKAMVRRIARKMFFGFEPMNVAGEWMDVSDPEKTIIDFFYYNEPLDRETLGRLRRKIDAEKLAAYLKSAPAGTRQKVLAAISKRN